MNEADTDGAVCSRKLVSGSRVERAVKSLDNARDLQLECARVLHETFLVPLIIYGVRQCYGKRRRDVGLGCTEGQPQRIARY